VPTPLALRVVEDRHVDRPGQVVVGELRGAPRVEDLVEGLQLRERDRGGDLRLGPLALGRKLVHRARWRIIGSTAGQTLSRMRACALGGGMELVGLEELRLVCDPFEQEGHQRHAIHGGDVAEELAELGRVIDAIIRGNHHAREHRARRRRRG
jgi:hypothetical protein